MNEVEFETAPPPARPNTVTVIGLLAVVAAVFSYLITYAMANALVAAEVLTPWAKDHDPRPMWFGVCFAALIGLFGGFGVLARFTSARKLRQIDAMEQE